MASIFVDSQWSISNCKKQALKKKKLGVSDALSTRHVHAATVRLVRKKLISCKINLSGMGRCGVVGHCIAPAVFRKSKRLFTKQIPRLVSVQGACARTTSNGDGSLRETPRTPKPKRQRIIPPNLARATSAFNYPRGCEHCLEVVFSLRSTRTNQSLARFLMLDPSRLRTVTRAHGVKRWVEFPPQPCKKR